MNKYHLKNGPNREILDKNEILELLENGKFAIISLCRDNEPYIVTLSYGFDNEQYCYIFIVQKLV